VDSEGVKVWEGEELRENHLYRFHLAAWAANDRGAEFLVRTEWKGSEWTESEAGDGGAGGEADGELCGERRSR